MTVSELSSIGLTHWTPNGTVSTGEIVVASSRSSDVVEIFRALFEIRYPIASLIPIGDLPPGIETRDPWYNNTSGLHCRFVAGTTTWSEHARGLAIDINPLWNPLVSDSEVWPSEAASYVDRSLDQQGMIVSDGEVVAIFEEHGWHWGGNWSSIKDYHHFSTTGR